ncbi:hypothetical protein, partial [Burkholderia ubonensis]|uniref:hypothetical protein n=1 Tax=Burkholderia ubonensis TaxID=101571 RepID=UPI001E4C9FB8
MRKISKLPFRILVSGYGRPCKQRADDLLSLERKFAVTLRFPRFFAFQRPGLCSRILCPLSRKP